jgi:acetylornithine deacetylase/succinyl-diaminopimelate desuccinylase family protein
MSDMDQNARDALCAIVDSMTDEIVELTCQLVKIESLSPTYPGVDTAAALGGEAACNEALAEVMRTIGCDVELVEASPRRANAVGVYRGSGGHRARSLAFNGHLDVVPYGALDQWSVAPTGGVVRDGRIWGRGSCDMKGPVAAMIKAVDALARSGVRLAGDVVLQCVVGEEAGDQHFGTGAVVEAGYGTDAAIVTEPSVDVSQGRRMGVNVVSNGLVVMRMTITGKSTHIALRHELVFPGGRGDAIGVNAIEKAVFLIGALHKLEQNWALEKRHPLFPPGKFNLHPGVIRGGPVGAQIPFLTSEYCTVEYAIWYHPDESLESVQREVTQFIHDACRLDPWLSRVPPTLEWPTGAGPYHIDPDAEIVAIVKDAHRSVTRQEPLVAGFIAGCDATTLCEHGVPTLVYGPGELSVAHAPDEYVDIDELVQACKVYALSAAEWCGVVS